MGRKCVAPGCKSGYDSNEEKVHMFSVPKSPALIKLWQKAILRDDIVLNNKHAVCENHFFESDIIWGSEVRGPDGNVMSRVKFEIPRLRKGALPQKFPNCPKYLSHNQKKRKSPKKRNIPRPAKMVSSPAEELHPDESNVLDNLKMEDNEIITGDEIIEGNGIIDGDEIRETRDIPDDISVFENCNPPEDNLFQIIFNDTNSVQFPISWSRQNITFGNYKMIQFTQYTAKFVKDDIQPVSSKQIIVKDNMKLWIAIFGKPIDLKEIGTKSSLASVDSIEKILDIVNKWELCHGCCNPGENECYENSVTHRDREGFLRHNKCTYVLSKKEPGAPEKMCTACYSAMETIYRRKIENLTRMKV